MARAAGKWLLIGIVLLTLAGVAAAAPMRQAGALLAALVSFNADVTEVSYSDVETGTAQVTLSWQTINTNGQYRLALDTYQQNQWVSILDENEALPLTGSRLINIRLPQNFGVPTYRLTLKTTLGEVIGQQFLTLPYTAAAQAAPQIISFTTMAQSIDTNLLVQDNARLAVSWVVVDRAPDTLLRFEQVLPDGSTISAEPSRSVLWLPSQGEGAIIPRPTASKEDLVFRLSLVSSADGTVYDQAEITLPVIGNVVIAPPQTGDQQALSATESNIEGEGITTFSAESASVAPGDSVTLSWDAGSAESVQLLETVPDGGPTTLYIELPPAGSMTIPLPEDSAGATYTLRAQSADGEVSTGEVNITPAGEGTSEGEG